MLRESRTDIREGVSPELLGRERSLQGCLNAKAARLTLFLNQNAAQEEVAALKQDITELTAEYDALEAQIRAQSPRYASLTQPRVLGLAEIQKQVLDPATLLLEYSLGKERSYLWAVTPDSMEAYELPGRSVIDGVVGQLYNSLTSPDGKRDSREPGEQRTHSVAFELSKMILGPVAARLSAKRLVIVADGLLQYVPFSALVDPARATADSEKTEPLAMRHQIVNLPSASVLAELRGDAARRPAAAKAVVVFADPVFDAYDARVVFTDTRQPSVERASGRTRSGAGLTLRDQASQDGPIHFGRLRFARQEAEEIAALVPQDECRVFFDFDASRTALLDSEVGSYRIVHFATHALLDNSHPALSGIVLSLVDRQGRPVDGFLRLNQIYNLKLGADLVVLSACQTALGKPVAGEGLLGLTRGFIYAGAPRIVASLWKVDDKATKELMRDFYEAMLSRHLTPAEALREAQVAIRSQSQWKLPYYWAGFVLQGDWR